MSDVLGTLDSGGAVSTGTSAKTLIQLEADTGHNCAVTGWGISFNGTTANDDRIKVDLIYQTTSGTMSGATPNKRDPSDANTLSATGLKNASGEPVTDYVLRSYYVDPEWGYTEFLQTASEIQVPAGSRFGIRVTAGADVSALPWMDFTEQT